MQTCQFLNFVYRYQKALIFDRSGLQPDVKYSVKKTLFSIAIWYWVVDLTGRHTAWHHSAIVDRRCYSSTTKCKSAMTVFIRRTTQVTVRRCGLDRPGIGQQLYAMFTGELSSGFALFYMFVFTTSHFFACVYCARKFVIFTLTLVLFQLLQRLLPPVRHSVLV